MKNKRVVKFLGVLISSLIVLNSNGQILAKKVAKIENIKQEKNKKNIKKRKSVKEKQEEVNKMLKDLKKNKTKYEKEQQQLNVKAFENFKKEDYEKEGFNLEVFFKYGAPILLYKHIKTGAKIIIIPTDSLKEKTFFSKPSISFDFNIYNENSKRYLDEFIKSAIISNFKVEDLKNNKFKGLNLFSVHSLSPQLEINFRDYDENVSKVELEKSLKKILSSLKSPKIFKDDKIFKLEKKRILNYLKNLLKEPDRLPFQTSTINIKEVENVTKNDILNFYENRVNPSNLLVINQTKLKDPKEILEFLKLLDEEYFKYYNYKKPNFPQYGSKVKNNYTVNGEINTYAFNYEEKEKKEEDYKFKASLGFSVNTFAYPSDAFIKKHLFLKNFKFSKKLLEKIKFKEYIKKLGYLNGHFEFSYLNLFANDKSLFEKEKLKENGRKIFNYVLEKIKNIPKKEIEEKYFRNYDEENNGDVSLNKDYVYTNPVIYISTKNSLKNVFVENFLYFNKPFSKKFFEITPNNEIKDSNETLKSKFIEDFEKIDEIKKEFNENPYCFINVTSKEKKEKEKYIHKLLIPLEIKRAKNNPTLKYLSKYFLTTNFLDIKNYEYALPEEFTQAVKFLENYIGEYCTANEKLSNDTLKFYYKDFENSIKNYKITKEEFEKTKENFMNFITNKNFISFNPGIKIIENFLKNGYEEKKEGENQNRLFEITNKTPRTAIFGHYKYLLEDCLFENFDEYVKYTKILIEFIKKQNIRFGEGNIKITKEFAKDLLENVINPFKKIVERTEKLKKEFEENIEKISFEEFVNFVKSAKPVEKEKLEKDQKKMRELEEMSSYGIFYY